MSPRGEARHRVIREGGYRVVLNERLGGFRDWILGRDHRRFGLLMLAVLVVSTTVIIASEYLPSSLDLRVGDVASSTVVADRSLSFEDRAATERLREQVAAMVPTVSRSDPSAFSGTVADITALLDQVESVRAQTAPTTEGSAPIGPNSEAFILLRGRAEAEVSDASLIYLLNAPPATIAQMRQDLPSALSLIYTGTVSESTRGEARAKLGGLADGMDGPEAYRAAAYELMAAYARPNYVFDEPQTRARREQAMADVAPVIVTVSKGEELVTPGVTITEETLRTLEALGLIDTRPSWEIWLGTLLLVMLEALVVVGLTSRVQPALLADNLVMLALTSLIVLFTLLARLLVIAPLSPYLVPLAALAMLTSILARPRTALLLVSMMAINVGLLAGFDFSVTAVMLISAVFSLYSVSRLAQRTDLMLAGVFVALVAGAAVFAGELLGEVPVGAAFRASLWGIGNGVLSLVLTVSLLMVYETVFNLTTPLRLLELANPSQPLLRRLMQVAPGTYNHSVLMGNLAEAAAEAIDADPLLARVGAYYHDIGKIVRPEYFVENQLHVQNPHDKMTPSLSKLTITAHVSDGEALARAYGLPRPIIDIIRQHHGTSLVAWFYDKAQKSSQGVVSEDTYRYEGQKPTSPESAIIMLADSVEAAAKAMENPTVKKMQDLIRVVFKQKMDDGQLDDAQLTLGDMHKIRDVFENGLRGLAGHRIAYPRDDGHRVSGSEHSAPRVAAAGGGGHTPHQQRPRPARLRSIPGDAPGGEAIMDAVSPTEAALRDGRDVSAVPVLADDGSPVPVLADDGSPVPVLADDGAADDPDPGV